MVVLSRCAPPSHLPYFRLASAPRFFRIAFAPPNHGITRASPIFAGRPDRLFLACLLRVERSFR